MNIEELGAEMKRLSRLIDKGVEVLVDQSKELADAEHVYRHSRSQAWLQAPEGTVPQREAWVDGKCAEHRRRRDLADHLRTAALEALRSRRTQLSALQSLLAAYREDAAFSRTGPDMAA